MEDWKCSAFTLTVKWGLFKTKAAFVFWDDWGALTSVCSGCFTRLWLPVPSSTQWCATAADWAQRITTDSINRFTRPVMLWVWSLAFWHRFQKRGCCPSYGQNWTILHFLSILCWTTTGACSAKTPSTAICRRKSFLPVAINLYNSSLGHLYSLMTTYIYSYTSEYFILIKQCTLSALVLLGFFIQRHYMFFLSVVFFCVSVCNTAISPWD